jgi:redox-regulated HSP33 family molecular chaperone
MELIIMGLRIIQHTMEVEFECPNTKEKIIQTINNPQINHGKKFEDWEYDYIYIECGICGKEHKFEI